MNDHIPPAEVLPAPEMPTPERGPAGDFLPLNGEARFPIAPGPAAPSPASQDEDEGFLRAFA